MIEYKIDNGEIKKLHLNGDVSDLLTDISCLIGLCYGAIKKKSAEAADEFQESLEFAMKDKSFKAVIFSSEFFDTIEEKKKVLEKLKHDADDSGDGVDEFERAMAKIFRWVSEKDDCE